MNCKCHCHNEKGWGDARHRGCLERCNHCHPQNKLPDEVEQRFDEKFDLEPGEQMFWAEDEVPLVRNIKSLLADELARERETLANAIEMAKAGWVEQGRIEERKRTVEILRELASDPPLESNERRRGFQEAIDHALSLISKAAEKNT